MSQTPQEFIRDYERETSQHHLEATLAMIAEQAVYFFSDGSTHVGKQAIQLVLQRNFDSIRDEKYRISNVTWLIESQDVAVCVYEFAWSGIIAGAPATGSGRGTSVLSRSGEGWLVIHEHLSRGRFVG
jgi:ketosteroid isomerase-like protein